MSHKNTFDFDPDNIELRLNIKAETFRKVTDRLADKVVAQVGDELVKETIDGLDKKELRSRVLYQLTERAFDALMREWRDE